MQQIPNDVFGLMLIGSVANCSNLFDFGFRFFHLVKFQKIDNVDFPCVVGYAKVMDSIAVMVHSLTFATLSLAAAT